MAGPLEGLRVLDLRASLIVTTLIPLSLATAFIYLKQRGMLDETLVVWTTEFGRTPGRYERSTAPVTAATGQPVEVVLDGLTADSRYYYRMQRRAPEIGRAHV